MEERESYRYGISREAYAKGFEAGRWAKYVNKLDDATDWHTYALKHALTGKPIDREYMGAGS